ncbi:MAG: hypothetical protein K6G85_01655, partial [Eubacterium sp.]|nr:hypothetical protein [Eubacterium sp.]
MKKLIKKLMGAVTVATLVVSMTVGNSLSVLAISMDEAVMTANEMKKDAKSRVTGTNKTVTVKKVAFAHSYDYNQSTFNAYYNSDKNRAEVDGKKVTVNGTCTEIACMSYIEYMVRAKKVHFTKILGNALPSTDYQRMEQLVFRPLVNNAVISGYMPKKSGQYVGTVVGASDDLLKYFLETRGVWVKASYSSNNSSAWTVLNDKIKNDEEPVVADFNIEDDKNDAAGHSMLANGLYKVTVTYTKDGKEKSKTFDYIRVNDGWNNTTSYQY